MMNKQSRITFFRSFSTAFILITAPIAASAVVDADIVVYVDADFDGYGAPGSSTTVSGTVPTAGFAINDFDCGDFDPNVNAGMIDYNDAIDNDCDAEIDEDGIDFSDNTSAPVAVSGGTYSLSSGDDLVLDGSASIDPPASPIVDYVARYVWNINGGTINFISLADQLTLTEADYGSLLNPGSNSIELQVFDGFNVGSLISTSTIEFSAIPEPSFIALVGLGVIGLIGKRRRLEIA